MTVVKIHSLYSKLNESLTDLFDNAGARRTFTVPYVAEQSTADHVTAVGQAAMESGGLTKSLVSTAHKSGGKGWGSDQGSTIGHSSAAIATARSSAILSNGASSTCCPTARRQPLLRGLPRGRRSA